MELRKASFWSVFFLLLMLCYPSVVTAQKQKEIKMEVKNEPLPDVLKKLEKVSGYKILFVYDEISHFNVTCKVKAKNIEDALKQIIGTRPIRYSIEKQYVNISLREDVKRIASTAPQHSTTSSTVVLQGRIVDEANDPLPGVNVNILGTKYGSISSSDGSFVLQVNRGKAVKVIFSFVGLKNESYLFKGTDDQRGVIIKMSQVSSQLGEVVVTGMFTRRSESFTGSASSYSGEKLKSMGNQNILQSLSTLDPAIIISDNNLRGSDPNSSMAISINGKTSINGISDMYGSDPNLPLFILDGFETTLQKITDLSMDRVESITILKDAASTAIYGAKAANGVIVIETKKPVAGKLRFSYNGNYQLAWADLSDYNLMNASEKLTFEKLSGYYGRLDTAGEIFDDSQRALYYSRYKQVAAGRNSYWMNEPLHTAFTHEHSINAEGGDQAFRYGLTFRYKDNNGVMKGSERQNIDGTLNLSYRVNKFNFSNLTDVDYTDIQNNIVAFSKFSEANPFYAKRNADGDVEEVLEKYSTLTGDQYITNPLWDLQQKSFNKSNILSLTNNFIVEYRPIESLRIQGKIGLITSRGISKIFQSPFATAFINVDQLKRGSYNESNTNNTIYDGSLLASYGNVIGKHTYNFVGGAQLRESKTNTNNYGAIGYITDQFSNPNFSNGYPDGGKPSSSVSKNRSASFYLNANYAFDMRYLVDFNIRSDGSSVFGVNNPFSTTWSFGLGWNIHNENFMKPIKFVNLLKLRYSLGNPGNENFDAKIANSIYSYYTSYQNMFGLAAVVSKWGNKNLKWQRTRINNIGLDAELFKSKLYVTLDYSIKKTDPILLIIGQPTSTGTSSVPMNIGATKDKSWTLAVNYFIIKKPNISWQVNLNFLNTKTTYYNIGNLLEKYNQEGRASQTLLRYYDGASSTALYAVHSLGIDPMTGNELFLRKDGSYSFAWNASDEVICGDTTPDAEGHIGSNFRYKGFSIGASFRYRWGGQTELTTLLNKVENISNDKLRYNQDRRALHDRWQKPGDTAKFKRIDDTSTTNISSRFIADDNSFECSSIVLGYENSHAKWLKTIGLTAITYRMYMNNIFRISTVKEERGLDYPFQRSVSASLSLRF